MTEREWNLPLFLLRAIQVGLSIDDLDRLDFGDVIDIITESSNDGYEYKYVACQDDFDRF